MVVTTTTLTNIKTSSLAEFDDLTHMAFGSGTKTPKFGTEDPTLASELVRKLFDEAKVKSIGAGTYDFSGTLGLTEANGNTISNMGLFNASSGGDMKLVELLTIAVPKTVAIDLSVGVRITVEVINE